MAARDIVTSHIETESPQCGDCGDTQAGAESLDVAFVNPDCADNRAARGAQRLDISYCGLISSMVTIDRETDEVYHDGSVTNCTTYFLRDVPVMPLDGIMAALEQASRAVQAQPVHIDLPGGRTAFVESKYSGGANG